MHSPFLAEIAQQLADGDHSLKPRKAAGITLGQNLQAATSAIRSFIQQLT